MPFNLILTGLLDGFEVKLTCLKWALIAGCSQDAVSHDIVVLLKRRILVRVYQLV